MTMHHDDSRRSTPSVARALMAGAAVLSLSFGAVACSDDDGNEDDIDNPLDGVDDQVDDGLEELEEDIDSETD